MSARSTPQPVFAILSALIEGRAGLHYSAAERELFMDRAGLCASEAGFESLLDYYYFLRYDPAGALEVDKLVEALAVNETFFFRELHPLQVLVKRFIAPLVARGLKPRVWSAACATGEEPLTLAMLLADANLLDQVELTASDISARVLDRASHGRFSRHSLRETSELRLAQRWIHQEGNGLRVDPFLAQAITWQRINLCEPALFPGPATYDFILCRNVLIYFSDQTVGRVLQGLTRALRPGGALFVGISESLLRFGSSLVCEVVEQAFFYRRAS